jgi:integrase
MNKKEEEWFEAPGSYKVLMDGRWELKDLLVISREFEQCYAFIYCFDAEASPLSEERIEIALRGYPWKGGYSYLNIYTVLESQVRWRDRPRVRSIQYASPGWIELAINADVAVQLAKSIAALAAAGAFSVKSYAAAAKELRELNAHRKQKKIEHLKLTAEQDKEMMRLCNEHARHLGFNSVAALIQHTGNPEIALRLLLAHHRRINELIRLTLEDKAKFPTVR